MSRQREPLVFVSFRTESVQKASGIVELWVIALTKDGHLYKCNMLYSSNWILVGDQKGEPL